MIILALNEVPVPVSFQLPFGVWIAWLSSIGIGLTALVLIWRYIIKAATLISNINAYGSVIAAIAKEFKSDSGSTLRDAINRVEKAAEEAKSTAAAAQKMNESLGRIIFHRSSPAVLPTEDT